jgi:uncharacterized membrane protein YphA (DoxX/SURF4 family)
MIDLGRRKARPLLSRACQVAVGVVFLIAALGKIGDLESFAGQVHNFRLVPVAAENLVAVALPWIEVVAGLSLVLGIRARSGAVVAAGLMAVFVVAVAAALARDLSIECGCFGKAGAARVGWVKLAQNLGLLLLAVGGTIRER